MTRAGRLILVYWLPAAAWAAVVLGASTEAFAAPHTAHWLAVLIERMLGHPLPPPRFALLHYLVRKAGHLTEYGILGALLLRALRADEATPWTPRWVVSAIGLALAVAVLDEWHQLYVPSRTGTPSDVALDAAGAAFGTLWSAVTNRSSSRAAA